MNRYVNSNERTHLMRLGSVMVAADEAVAEYAKAKSVDKEFIRYIKTMGTYAKKALGVRTKYLEPQSVVKLANESRNHVIVLKNRTEAAVEMQQTAENNKVTPIVTEELLDLIEITIQSTCVICDGAKEQDCVLKRILLNNDIEPLDPAAPAGVCGYRYRGGK